MMFEQVLSFVYLLKESQEVDHRFEGLKAPEQAFLDPLKLLQVELEAIFFVFSFI